MDKLTKGVENMAIQSTFVKLDRNITTWRWYKNPNTFRVFMHLLITANFAPYELENITIERGQLATSHEAIANTLNLTIQEVRTALGHLKSTGEITATIYRRFQVISIVNYNSYQGESTGTATGYQQADNRLSTSYQQRLKNNKEYKEGKEIYISDSNESEISSSKPQKAIKHKYGEYKNVLLTDEELQKLKTEFSDYESRIENLSSYVASTGKKYKSHYATIRNWARKDKETKPQPPTSKFLPQQSLRQKPPGERREPTFDVSEFTKKAVGIKYVPPEDDD